jgi:hypothetical protein
MEERDDLAQHLMADMPDEEREHFEEVLREADEAELTHARRNDPETTESA